MSKTRMNADRIVEIMKWSDKGLNATDVAKVVGISESSSQNYIRIIKRIRNGEDYSCHPKVLNEGAIAEYCDKAHLKITNNTYTIKESETCEAEEPENMCM